MKKKKKSKKNNKIWASNVSHNIAAGSECSPVRVTFEKGHSTAAAVVAAGAAIAALAEAYGRVAGKYPADQQTCLATPGQYSVAPSAAETHSHTARQGPWAGRR